jgi:hypothetical protein
VRNATSLALARIDGPDFLFVDEIRAKRPAVWTEHHCKAVAIRLQRDCKCAPAPNCGFLTTLELVERLVGVSKATLLFSRPSSIAGSNLQGDSLSDSI